ncbi:MAG TPA: hypothetical protein DCQ50_03210, partial [Chryseobacterium sp.]|nr:hypothetical protein [Chryseobacterium sp.]
MVKIRQMEQIIQQKHTYNELFSEIENYSFHISTDPLIRYLRDRRLNISLSYLQKIYGNKITGFSVLIVCGGVGGEAIFFKRNNFNNVLNSDLSDEAAITSKTLDKTLHTDIVNAENLPYNNNSFDIVIVQDGLHHLPRR